MRELIVSFPDQLDKAWKNANSTHFKGPSSSIQNVVITGLGGSGIGGKFMSQLILETANVPIAVNNDYRLPGFVSEATLVIISSYSGNTEETVSAMKEAISKGAMVACISSGGEVTELAEANSFDIVRIPGGNPPRSQFGYSSISLARVLEAYGIAPEGFFNRFESMGAFLSGSNDAIQKEAKRITEASLGKQIILYSEVNNEGVAIRWRQQLNENSKLLCWHHVYPEMNHNELVGWESGNDDIAAILLRSEDDFSRSVKRMDITKEIYKSKGAMVIEVDAKGATKEERGFYLVNLGDWVSLLYAEAENTDPVIITNIDFLKNELSKF
ncbi:MAG: glucose/mannose-6-phosphate isomerase [Flavobacteriales bacterium]|jgi:glucose/mannose-6-phosphate isomerase